MVNYREILDCVNIPIAILDERKNIKFSNLRFKKSPSKTYAYRLFKEAKLPNEFPDGYHLLSSLAGIEDTALIVGIKKIDVAGRSGFLMMFSESAVSAGLLDHPLRMHGEFTEVELAIAQGLLGDFSTTEIAKNRSTKPSTVRWHLKNIQSKLAISQKTQVVSWLAQSPVRWLRP